VRRNRRFGLRLFAWPEPGTLAEHTVDAHLCEIMALLVDVCCFDCVLLSLVHPQRARKDRARKAEEKKAAEERQKKQKDAKQEEQVSLAACRKERTGSVSLLVLCKYAPESVADIKFVDPGLSLGRSLVRRTSWPSTTSRCPRRPRKVEAARGARVEMRMMMKMKTRTKTCLLPSLTMVMTSPMIWCVSWFDTFLVGTRETLTILISTFCPRTHHNHQNYSIDSYKRLM